MIPKSLTILPADAKARDIPAIIQDLRKAGYSYDKQGILCGVTDKTVWNWANNIHPIPYIAATILIATWEVYCRPLDASASPVSDQSPHQQESATDRIA